MKRISSISLLALALCLLGITAQAQQLPPIEVHFSPKGGCTEAVVRELEAARESVLVQAYSFTSPPIAKALVEAHRRGVKIQVILDKSQRTEKYSSATFLCNAGIPTFIDAAHAIAHNKVMVIDGATVITGSFNFTRAAEENNAENLLVIRAPDLAVKYTANWEAHLRHSEPYEGRPGAEERSRAAEAEEMSDSSPPAPAGEYVGSKRSEVFHRESCEGAAKISVRNLVRYASREEAIQAGKRPCAMCKP